MIPLFVTFFSTMILCVIVDIVSYRMTPAARKNGYYPNLSLWGLGFLIVLCLNFFFVLNTILTKTETLPANGFDLTYKLALLAVPVVLLVFTILGVTKIGQRD